MVTDEVLAGSRLKVKRAKQHVSELRALTEPLHHKFYHISVDNHCIYPEFDEPGIFINYRPLQAVAEELALIIGDIVHNYRAALDHLSSGICRSASPLARVNFPMFPERHKLEGASVWEKLEVALPGSKELFLKEIRPENGPGEQFWRFNGLDNDDKHNLLIPTVSLYDVQGISVRDADGNSFENLAVTAPVDRPACLVACTGYATLPSVTVENNARVGVRLNFSEGTIFGGALVHSTLAEIDNLVTKTIGKFAQLIERQAAR